MGVAFTAEFLSAVGDPSRFASADARSCGGGRRARDAPVLLPAQEGGGHGAPTGGRAGQAKGERAVGDARGGSALRGSSARGGLTTASGCSWRIR